MGTHAIPVLTDSHRLLNPVVELFTRFEVAGNKKSPGKSRGSIDGLSIFYYPLIRFASLSSPVWRWRAAFTWLLPNR
jgi:hypothetical protein